MAQDITGTLPNFSSANEVLPYLLENRNRLTMMQITDAVDWALDPGFVQRDAITQFILSLPRAQEPDEKCRLCYEPYGTDSPEVVAIHFAIVLPCCWHIVGAPCLYQLLKDSESCSLCRETIFTRPPRAPPLDNPASKGILRALLKSGRTFIDKEDSMLLASGYGSGSDRSYAAFCSWAHGKSSNVENIIARTLARDAIRRFELSSITS